MGLFDLLTGYRPQKIVDGLAKEVAQHSLAPVWERVARRAAAMRLNEGRGYVRARAAQIISAQADRVLAREPRLAVSLRSQVIAAAADLVVSLVIRDILNLPIRRPVRQAA